MNDLKTLASPIGLPPLRDPHSLRTSTAPSFNCKKGFSEMRSSEDDLRDLFLVSIALDEMLTGRRNYPDSVTSREIYALRAFYLSDVEDEVPSSVHAARASANAKLLSALPPDLAHNSIVDGAVFMNCAHRLIPYALWLQDFKDWFDVLAVTKAKDNLVPRQDMNYSPITVQCLRENSRFVRNTRESFTTAKPCY